MKFSFSIKLRASAKFKHGSYSNEMKQNWASHES